MNEIEFRSISQAVINKLSECLGGSRFNYEQINFMLDEIKKKLTESQEG